MNFLEFKDCAGNIPDEVKKKNEKKMKDRHVEFPFKFFDEMVKGKTF